VLPLARDAGKIALVGTLADNAFSQLGAWRARGQADEAVTLRAALEAAHAGVTYVPEGAAPAVAAAEASDVVVLVLGEDFDRTGEARSFADISLPPDQLELLAALAGTGKPLVVLLSGGRPLAVPEVAGHADAVLATWLLGVEAGPAMVRTLFGDSNPAGRLPATFPRASGAVPFAYDQLPSGRPASDDLASDSVRWRDQPITPLWAFGHGLSYTTFEYGALTLDRASIPADGGTVTVSVPVTNTGARAGDEVVQLYMRDPVASVSRPVMQLRGTSRKPIPASSKRWARKGSR
jgi:beta-glucosidase